MNTVIWDWNGTLLNDIELCINSINKLLEKRNLPKIETKTYKEVFSFPVQDYYQSLGFDFEKEDFSIPAHQFIYLYKEGFDSCSMQKNSGEVLSWFKEKGVRQFVLSAMEHEMLENTLEKKGIANFFEGIAGLKDHYAVSKIEQGTKLIRDFNIEIEKTWLIGDTIHDYEVASELGVKCILIADGHQSAKRLLQTGGIVIESLQELFNTNYFEI
ncbi:MAG TPA: HAD hydrolase-like protein [Draconibacterium sp.]|nr:HAD hydrolase-like protein [Draconibacterium sp.]